MEGSISDPGNEKLLDLKRWFESSEEANRVAFDKMERDQDYYDGKQLTQEEYDKLKQRGQPPIVINKIRRKIDFMLGLEAQQRNDPKAFPRTPADAASAEVATDALRYIADCADYPYHRARAWRDLLVTGVGGIQVNVSANKAPIKPQLLQMGFNFNNPHIDITRTPWDRMWWDSHSQEPDFSDCMHRGIVIWMDAKDARAKYRDADGIISATIDKASRTDIYDDKPRYRAWADAQRQRVRVVQCWWRDGGEVYWAEYTEQGILAGGQSPWLDTYGDQQDPFIWRSAYVDRDGNRHGVVRDMIDPQDEVNKRRSKALHLMTMRQVIADRGAVDDPEKAKRQLARPDGFIEKNPGMEFDIAENMDLSSGQMTLLQHASAELEMMGPNADLQGNGEDGQSGRAVQARQQGGMVELGPMLDHLRSMDLEVYEKSWARAKQFWQAPQFIRVTDRDDAPSFVGLNEPMVDPHLRVVGSRNNVGDLDIDIVIEQGPDVAVIEQEVWADLMNVLPQLASMPPNMQEVMIEAMPYPATKKKRLMEMIKGGDMDDPQVQQRMQQQQQEEQLVKRLGFERQTAETDKIKAEAVKIMREASEPTPQPESQPDYEPERLRLQQETNQITREKNYLDHQVKIEQLQHSKAEKEMGYQRDTQAQLVNQGLPPDYSYEADRKSTEALIERLSEANENMSQAIEQAQANQAQTQEMMAHLIHTISAPKRLIKDENGEIVGAETAA